MFTYTSNRFFDSIYLLFLVLTLSACNSGSEASATNSDVEPQNLPLGIVISDDDSAILKAVYFDIRIPEGFYTESYADSSVYYSISHVKNVELLPLADRSGIVSYELSTDDFTEALEWSEQAANYQPAYKQLVDNRETDLYFEFTRVDLNNPQFVHLSRVFKNNALDRSNVSLAQSDIYQGIMSIEGLSGDRVKMLMEYLWTFSFSNNTGNAVLKSNTIETDISYIHTMEEAKLTIRSADQCDTVEIFETTYTVQKDTGDIWKEQEMIREISSKRYGDEFEICE